MLILGLGGELQGVWFEEAQVSSDSVLSALDALLGGLGNLDCLLGLLGFGGHN